MKKKKEKIEVTYKLINQIKDKLKVKKGYKGLLSIATYLITMYFEDYYKKEEYEYFTEYKITILILNLMKWLAIADNPHQFGHKKFDFRKYLREGDKELESIKKGVFSMWQNDILGKKLEKMIPRLLNATDRVEEWKLQLYVEMLEDLLDKYPIYLLEEEVNFKKDIELC